jgi:predicted GNAT family N-acyltransferase
MQGTEQIELVHRLTPRQIDRLVELYRNEWWTTNRERVDVERMLEGSDVVLALQDAGSQELIAFARALTDGVYKALIFDVMVTPAYRGRSIGCILMGALLDHPLLRKVRHVELYCLPELTPFYRQWGFAEDVGGVRLMRARPGLATAKTA